MLKLNQNKPCTIRSPYRGELSIITLTTLLATATVFIAGFSARAETTVPVTQIERPALPFSFDKGQFYELAQGVERSRKNGGRRGPPPREALDACKTQEVQSACSFIDSRRNKSIDSTCQQSPRGEQICVPNDRKPSKS